MLLRDLMWLACIVQSNIADPSDSKLSSSTVQQKIMPSKGWEHIIRQDYAYQHCECSGKADSCVFDVRK